MAENRFGYQAHYVVLSQATAGSSTIIAAKSGVKFRVVSGYMISSNTNSVTFQSDTGAISGTMDFTSQERMTLPLSEYGWFQTDAGESLAVTLSNSNKVAGMLTYFET